MRTTFAPILAAAFAVAATFGLAAPASANTVPSCGAFDFSANTNCELKVSGGCTAACEPVNFTAQCSGELYVGCKGGCTAQVDVGCTGMCQASCEAECDVDPGTFNCAASCRTDCSARCDGTCVGMNNTAECRSSCKATCSGECDTQCNVTPPSADCKAQCQSCCTGSCKADANMQCQVDCQSTGYLDCETSLTGGCQADCAKPDGALFCDGQYVDVGNQLDACANALKEALQIEVTGYAYADGSCDGASCSAEAGAGCSCATVGHGNDDPREAALGMLGALAAFGLAVSRRKQTTK